MRNEKIYLSVLTAIAVLLGIFENMIPAFFAFAPGAKIGLPNLIIIIAMFTLNWRQVWTIQILRLGFTALFTGFSVFLYSFAGAVLSLLAMYVVKQFGPRLISMIGISVVGGFFHNLGQLLVASLIAQSPQVLYYLPVLTIFGLLAGLAIGVGANQMILRVENINRLFNNKNKEWLS
ncbi:Gx transporter family protein [Lactococcus termiticola]|uniref:Heptaprenyl diphosphate synthase subunit I n=1 Tax=Lactococcus termiticola TaxID=2169526 RepID=A0A2R5HK71_9LACT|nr:Gx transporter family protein [Lactococcus termiticola]GBG97158.1 heptaprenyl diphosphate synthase subunit I [Lactococcus termiticola]